MAGYEIWLVVAIIFIIGEMFTEGFFLLWFGVGAMVSALAAFLGYGDDVTQWTAFLLTSAILVLLTRPFAARITKTAPRMAAVDALIGKKARVIEEINGDKNTGRIVFKGDDWKAEASEVISKGEMVEIKGIEGTHAIVERIIQDQ